MWISPAQIWTVDARPIFPQVFPLAYRHANDLLIGSEPQDNAFTRRLDFLTEADQLKSVIRASRLMASDRLENSAEHSWHIMLYAWVLSEHAHSEIRVDRVLQMLLLHDIVEIDAGDHPYSRSGQPRRAGGKGTSGSSKVVWLVARRAAGIFRGLVAGV